MSVRLAIDCASGCGVPLLFVHGFSHHRHVWSRITDALDARYRPIRFDLRGHGDSAWSVERHYAVSDHASDIARALDEVGVEPAVLVGHSLGGLAAIHFTAAHSERVAALVLVDTGPALSLAGLGQVARDNAYAPACFESPAHFADWLAATMPLARRDDLAALAEHALVERTDGAFEPRLDPGVLEPEIDPAAVAQHTAQIETALAKISCETLVIRGGLSALLGREAADALANRQLAHGRLVTLERAGHAVMLDDPEGLRRAIEDFLERPGVLDPAIRKTPTGHGATAAA